MYLDSASSSHAPIHQGEAECQDQCMTATGVMRGYTQPINIVTALTGHFEVISGKHLFACVLAHPLIFQLKLSPLRLLEPYLIAPKTLFWEESPHQTLHSYSISGGTTQQRKFHHLRSFKGSGRDILNATVKQRKAFTELVSSASNLQLAEIPGWAGLGGVRYIPDIWLAQEVLADSAKEDINALNVHLVSQLKATDSAFSLGEAADGVNCVRFGMVTAETDISELLSLVISTGREIETSSKFLDQMTDIVRKGIEAATEDLRRENDERLWQEGILRHVPIVGSVYNWFSPPPPPGIKGRTLDLTAGVLESTENIYRYHMQIRHGTAPTRTETKLPPAPSVQTSVTPSASSPSHSRSSSTTSALAPGSTHSRQASDQPTVTPDSKTEQGVAPVAANGIMPSA
ncbi:pyridoxal-dependent decarboxylase domain-containing protein 1-like [Penaeus indicus]|uniref:pyridoxal-dependent decarboxylase domain-containing protein 1-like n=1 Tax=Penaeus indicus TaxID=29960 RepID=UPI00300D4D59